MRLVDPLLVPGLNATLIESGHEAWAVRLRLLEQAQERIQFSTYQMLEGATSELFIGGLMEAAQRGVTVEVIIDGMTLIHRFGPLKSSIEAFSSHPNVTFKLYDPPTVTLLYAWQNRLHDKLLIIDETYALTGGRNLGDRYFFHQDVDVKTFDREVLIWSDTTHETLIDMVAYFDVLFGQAFNHTLSETPHQDFLDLQEALIQNTSTHRQDLTVTLDMLLSAGYAVNMLSLSEVLQHGGPKNRSCLAKSVLS